MAETPPLKLRDYPFMVRLLLTTARWFVPNKDKEWLEDMLFELPFVPPGERLKWAYGAFALAFGLRFSAAERSTAVITFGTFAITATVVALVILPNRHLPQPALTPNSGDTPELADNVTDFDTPYDSTADDETSNEETRAVAETTRVATETEPSAIPTNRTAAQAAAEPPAPAAAAPFPSETLTEATVLPSDRAEDGVTLEVEEPLGSVATADINAGAAEADSLNAASTVTDAANAAPEATSSAPLIVATTMTYVELYRGDTRAEDTLILEQTLTPGDTLELSPPVLLYTDNAGGLTLKGKPLGETGQSLERFFAP